MNTIYKPLENINDSSNTTLTPRDYQLEAIDKLRGKQRTVCQLPCGMGKTLIAIKLAEQYNQVIVITPLKIYCEQNMERFKSQMPSNYSMMIIDSDNDGRNIDKIKKFIGDNEKICLFATFKSVDIVNKLISDKIVNNYYVIIDEFHNLSVSDILEDDLEDDLEEELLDQVNNKTNNSDNEEEDDLEDFEEDDLEDSDEDIEEPENNQSEMYKLLHSDARILFMSATPKLMGSDNDYSEDCDIDEEIFGNIDYKMDMRTAIERGGICDYMVYVPTLSIEKSTGLDKIQEEVDISKYDKELVIKARFIIRGMMNNGSRKCIVYLQTQEECRVMNTILADVGTNYFAIDVNSNYIISDSSREERKAIIKSFTDGEGYNFLCNVNILNECIDIPECDSIFIAYPSKSKIRNIQRMCRANRKNKAMTDKIARIYIWADEYKDELVDFIGHLKEYDSQFTFDKVKRLNVIGNKTAVMKSSDAVEENKKLEDIMVGVKRIKNWDDNFDIAKDYLKKNNKRPSNKNGMKEEQQISNWIFRQERNYKTKTSFMADKKKYDKYTEFRKDYQHLLKSNNEIWYINRNILRNFVLKEHRMPINNKKNKTEKKIWQWMRDRINEDNNNNFKDENKKKSWNDLKSELEKYFTSNKKEWIKNSILLDKFILKNNRLPKETKHNKHEEKLREWYNLQEKSLKFNLYIIKNDPEIKQKYIELKQKHSSIMISFEDEWKNRLKKINENKIGNNNLLPIVKRSKVKGKIIVLTDKELEQNSDSLWLRRQDKGYLKNNLIFRKLLELKNLWIEFRTNNIEYFRTNEEKWELNSNELIECLDSNIIEYNKKYDDEYSRLWYIYEILPNNTHDKNYLTIWGSRQQSNYRLNKNSLIKNNNQIRIKWEQIIKKYGNLYPTYEEELEINLNIIEKFIMKENRFPMDTVKSIIESKMRIWFRTKKSNYASKTKIMNKTKCREIFEKFLQKYNKYL